MEMMVTAGAISRAKLRQSCHHQLTNTQFFYRPDALPVTQPTVAECWRKWLGDCMCCTNFFIVLVWCEGLGLGDVGLRAHVRDARWQRLLHCYHFSPHPLWHLRELHPREFWFTCWWLCCHCLRQVFLWDDGNIRYARISPAALGRQATCMNDSRLP